MAEDDKVDTRIPLNLHSGNWSKIAPEYHAEAAVSRLQAAHASTRQAMVTTLQVHETVMNDPTCTAAKNLERSASGAERRKADALARIDEAVRSAQSTIAALDEAMERQDAPSPHMLAAIAGRLAAMAPEERRKILGHAVQSDDRVTLGAVFSGPAWLHGLSDEERNLYREQYRRTRFPDLIARKAAISQAIDIAVNGGTSLAKALTELIDGRAVLDAQNRAAAAQRALDQ